MGPLVIAGRECGAALLEQSAEPVAVELPRLDAQQVPAAPREEHSLTSTVQRLPQPRDVDLDDLRGTGRRLVWPQLVDQPVGGNHLIRMKEQERQDRALLSAANIGPAP